MAVNVQSTIEPYNESYKVVNAKHVGVGEPGQEKALDEVLNDLPGGGGSECEIPTFDLTVLGLGAVVPGGDIVVLETDTTEITAALEKGAVKFIASFNIGTEISTALVLNPAAVLTSGEYSCTAMNEFSGTFLITTVNVANGFIAAKCTPMDSVIGAYIDAALGGDY